MTAKVSDVMTREVVTVDPLEPFKKLVELIQTRRVSALPVVDERGSLVGIVSEGDLILKEDTEYSGRSRWFEAPRRVLQREKAAGRSAGELMSIPVVSISPDATLARAARTMHRNGIKRLPVVDADERLVGIVSRSDLLKVFLRPDADIARVIRDDVIGRTLWMEPDSIRVVVHDGVVVLEGEVERRELVPFVEQLVGSVEGVVGVDNRLSSADHGAHPSDWRPMSAAFLPRVVDR